MKKIGEFTEHTKTVPQESLEQTEKIWIINKYWGSWELSIVNAQMELFKNDFNFLKQLNEPRKMWNTLGGIVGFDESWEEYSIICR